MTNKFLAVLLAGGETLLDLNIADRVVVSSQYFVFIYLCFLFAFIYIYIFSWILAFDREKGKKHFV